MCMTCCSSTCVYCPQNTHYFHHTLNLLNIGNKDYMKLCPKSSLPILMNCHHQTNLTFRMANGGCIMTETCNQAHKVCSNLSNLVPGSIDFDCMNHLWNVWFGNTEKALTKELNILLQSSLDEIDPQL